MTTPPPVLFFSDTTVLLNFGLAGELDALGALLAGRGKWSGTVAHETGRQGRRHGLPELRERSVLFLGEPVHPHDGEHRLTRERRLSFASPGDAPDEHLGEAETLTIIETRALHAVFITDDGQVPGRTHVPCLSTWDIVRTCFRRGILTLDAAVAMHACLLQRRRVHVPELRDPGAFVTWLTSS
ncbi:MAG: hypothetical protein L0G22_04700 [Propionibacteriaceae bacterium]|nr:hypothetical protein [Propionibacteriaceae bacterium]